MGERRESSERQSFMIKVIIIVILLLLSFLATILYVYAYPKTTVRFVERIMYDGVVQAEEVKYKMKVKKHSKLYTLPTASKNGYTFQYWTTDPDNPIPFDANGTTMESDVFTLYAYYTVNSYRVTYYVQKKDPLTNRYYWSDDPFGYVEMPYGSEIVLPTGRQKDANGVDTDKFVSALESRKGFSFVGWSTSVTDENEASPLDVYKVYQGQETIFPLGAQSVSLYAYYEKNSYTMNLYSGLEYYFEDGSVVNPETTAAGTKLKTDVSGNFVIGNCREEKTENIEYLSQVTSVTDKYSNITLDPERDGIGYDQYDFLGWYFDEDYTKKVVDYSSTVVDVEKVDENNIEKPIIYLYNESGDKVGEIKSSWNEVKGKYEFNIFSKWKRRNYEIKFNKNHNSAPFTPSSTWLYKYDDQYGKFYDCMYDLKNATEATYTTSTGTKYFYLSNRGASTSNTFTGWVLKARPEAGDKWYHTRKLVGGDGSATIVGIEGAAPAWTAKVDTKYDDGWYTHYEGNSVTFYAQWAPTHILEFRYQNNGGNVVRVECISRDIVNLLPYSVINGNLGWVKEHYNFIGWSTSSNIEQGNKIYESTALNGGFKYPIPESGLSKTYRLYAIWDPIMYKITFDANGGTFAGGQTQKILTRKGNETISRTQASTPIRDGYLFEGWSLAPIKDNTPNSEKVNFYPKNSFNLKVVSNLTLYASWTVDFIVEYNSNGGIGNVPPKVLYSNSSQAKESTLVISAASTSISKAHHIFKGWTFKDSAGNLNSTKLIKSGTYAIVNFATGKWCAGQTYNEDNAISLQITGDMKNTAILYAVWEPRQYSIRLQKSSGDIKTLKLAYNDSEGFTYNITNMKVDTNDDGVVDDNDKTILEWARNRGSGEQLLGWATANSNNEEYRLPNGTSLILKGTEVVANEEYYAIYQKVIITVRFNVEIASGDIGHDSNLDKTIAYNTQINNLPILTSADYGDAAYDFGYWYFEDASGNEVTLKNGDVITYYTMEGSIAVLDVYSKFIKQTYSITFNIYNPLNNSIAKVIKREVIRGSSTGDYIDEEQTITFYDEIMNEAKDFAKTIKQYTFVSFTYASAIGRVDFSKAITWDNFTFPNITAGSEILFTTTWNANPIVIEYSYSYNNQKENSKHKSLDYAFSGELMLLGQDALGFETDGTKSITAWQVIKSDGTAVGANYVFAVGDYMISQSLDNSLYSSFKDFDSCIEWTLVGDTYTGTLYLSAMTNDIYTIEYYKWNGVAEISIDTESVAYNGNAPYAVLKDASSVVGNSGLIFNGWRVGSKSGELISVSDAIINLSQEKFPTFTIRLYADLSFKVNFVSTGINFDATNLGATYSLQNGTLSKTISIYDNGDTECVYDNGYFDEFAVNSIPYFASVSDGYTGYAVVYNSNIFDLTNTTLYVTYTGGNHDIYVNATREITITFNVKDNETILKDGNVIKVQNGDVMVNATTYTQKYVIDINGEPVSNMQAGLTAYRLGCSFLGWANNPEEIDSSLIFGAEDQLPFDSDTTLYAIFSSPNGNTILATIQLVYGRDAEGNIIRTPYTATCYNGNSYELPKDKASVGASGWTKSNYQISAWRLNATTNNPVDYAPGAAFNIPTEIEEGKTYVFDAIWDDEYIVTYDGELSQATNVPTDEKSLLPNMEMTVSDVIPTLESEPGITFENWVLGYQISNAITMQLDFYPIEMPEGSDIDYVTLKAGDKLKFVKDSLSGVIMEINGATRTYSVPRQIYGEGIVYNYVLMAQWDKTTYNVQVNIAKDHSNNPTTDNIYTYNFSIEYGDTLSTADIIAKDTSNIISGLITADSGIKGFSNIGFNDVVVAPSVLTEIKTNLVLYSVWDNKYSLTYAPASDVAGSETDFDYLSAMETEYYYENDRVSFNRNVITSVFKKGYTTVYFNDGTYYIVKDDGTNGYYRLIGFDITWNTTNTRFVGISESMTAPAYSMVATPKFEEIYKVEFIENRYTGAAYTTNVLNAIYVSPNTQLDLTDLSSYIADYSEPVAQNFAFKGYAETSSATTALNSIKITASTKLYVVWESSLVAKFVLGYSEIFQIKLNKEGKISLTELNTILTSTTNEYCDDFIYAGLENNANTFEVSGNYIYLSGFYVSNSTFTDRAALCNVVFTSTATITLVTQEIYILSYTAGETDGISDNDFAVQKYVTEVERGEYGLITETGVADAIYLLEEDAISSITCANMDPTGWKYRDYIWRFGTTTNGEYVIPQSNFNTIISAANFIGYTLDLTISWEGEAFSLKVRYAQDPKTAYSAIDNLTKSVADTWVNGYNLVYGYSSSGLVLLQTVAGDVTARLGQNIAIMAPADIVNFTIIGWSVTPVKLGEIPASYYASSKNTYNSYTLHEIDSDFVAYADADNVVYLYPVYQANESNISNITINLTNGNAKYTVTFGASGYVYADPAMLVTDKVITANTKVTLNNLYNINISYNVPNKYYSFSHYVVNTFIDSSSTAIVINNVSSSSIIEVVYALADYTLNISLNYEYALKSGTDTSLLEFAGKEIGNGVTSASATIKYNENLKLYANNLSEYYPNYSITLQNGEETQIISNPNAFFNIHSSLLEVDDTIDVIITLHPTTYTVTFDLSGGYFEGQVEDVVYVIAASNPTFAVSGFELDGSQIYAVAGSTITLPNVVKDKWAFTGWRSNDSAYNNETNYVVTKNVTFFATFLGNTYYITYIVDGTSTNVEFKGDSEVVVGTGISTEVDGFNFVEWKDSSGNTYVNGRTYTFGKKGYILTAVLEPKDVVVIYKNSHNASQAPQETYKYRSEFTTLAFEESNPTWTLPANKHLYGWTTPKGVEIVAGEKITDWAQLVDNYTSEITLTSIYYDAYTFTIAYTFDAEKSEKTDYTETYIVGAKDSAGSINANDLKYIINKEIPVGKGTWSFDGYWVKKGDSYIQESGQNVVKDNGGELLLEYTAGTYTYSYTLESQWDNSSRSAVFRTYITDPTDSSKYLQINGQDYIDIIVREVNGGFSLADNLPQYDYANNWTYVGLETLASATYSDFTFTTSIANPTGYRLAGFRLTYVEVSGGEEKEFGVVTSDAASRIKSSYYEYFLYAEWETRHKITYFDKAGAKVSSFYVNDKEKINIETMSYTADGHILLGAVHVDALAGNVTDILASKEVSGGNDYYYEFEEEVEVTKSLNLYPAFSKVYTLTFVNQETCGRVNFLAPYVELYYSRQASTYIVDLEDYIVRIAGDFDITANIGYSYMGLSLSASDIINVITEYTLDTDNADANSVINIYAVWATDQLALTIAVKAYANGKASGSILSDKEVIYYPYGTQIDFENDAKIIAFKESVENKLGADYAFSAYSLPLNASGKYEMLEISTLYLEYIGVYKVKFEGYGDAIILGNADAEFPDSLTVAKKNINEVDDSLNYFWTADGKTDIFGGKDNIVAKDLLPYADETYTITLEIGTSSKSYTYNLYFVKLDGDTVSTETKATVTGFNKGDTLSSSIAQGLVSQFDAQINAELGITKGLSGLYGLDSYYNNADSGFYIWSGVIRVNGKKYNIENYKVGSVLDSNGYEIWNNEVYLVYENTEFIVNITGAVVEDDDIRNFERREFIVYIDGVSYYSSSIMEVQNAQTIELINPSNETTEELKNIIPGKTFLNYSPIKVTTVGTTYVYEIIEWGDDYLDSYATFIASSTGVTISNVIKDMTEETGLIIAPLFNDIYVKVTIDITNDAEDIDDLSLITPSIFVHNALYISSGQEIAITSQDIVVNVSGVESYALTLTKNYSRTENKITFDILGGISIKIYNNIQNYGIATIQKASETDPSILGTKGYVSYYIEQNETITIDYEKRMFTVYFYAGDIRPSISIDEQFVPALEYYDFETDKNSISFDIKGAGVTKTLEFKYYYDQIPYGTTIDNYKFMAYKTYHTFNGWKAYSLQGELLSGANTITNDCLLVADDSAYTPVDVVVEFYDPTKTVVATTMSVDVNGDNLTYLGTIKLPTFIIDNGKSISYAWDAGEFGESITIGDNLKIKNGKYYYQVTALAYNYYYIVFDDGAQDYILKTKNASESFPQSKSLSHIVADLPSSLGENPTYTVSSGSSLYTINLSAGTATESTTNGFVLKTTYIIPEEDIADVGTYVFTHWETASGAKYNNSNKQYTYYYDDISATDNIIYLTAVGGEVYVMNMHFVNPITKVVDKAYTLTVDKSELVSGNGMYHITYTLTDNIVTIALRNGIRQIGNSMSFALDSGVDLSRYILLGYKQSSYAIYQGKVNLYDENYIAGDNLKTNALMYYKYSNTDLGVERSNVTRYAVGDSGTFGKALLDMLTKSSSSIDLYTIWEEKQLVEFKTTTAADGADFSESDYYGLGEVAPVPDSSDLELEKDGYAWTGWKWNTMEYVFDTIPVDNAGNPYIYAQGAMLITPLWDDDAVAVIINVNFDNDKNISGEEDWLTYYAEAVDTYVSGTMFTTIKAQTKYPELTLNADNGVGVESENANGVSEYRLLNKNKGKYLSKSATINLDYIGSNGYYEHTYYVTGTNLIANYQYFTLTGIYYFDAEGAKKYVKDIASTYIDDLGNISLEAFNLTGSVINLYLEWRPIELEINFTQDGSKIYDAAYIRFGQTFDIPTTDESGNDISDVLVKNTFGEVDKDYFNLHHWEAVNPETNPWYTEDLQEDLNNGTIRFIYDTELTPIFKSLYRIVFVSGDTLNELDMGSEYKYQFKALGDSVALSDVNKIYGAYLHTSNAYKFVDASGTIVSYAKDATTLSIPKTAVSDTNYYVGTEGLENTPQRTIYIHVYFGITITRHLPDGNTIPVVENINIGQMYSGGDLGVFDNVNVEDYNGAEFAGWYLSAKTSASDYYTNDISKHITDTRDARSGDYIDLDKNLFSVRLLDSDQVQFVLEGGTLKLRGLGDNDYSFASKDINLYAKLIVTTAIIIDSNVSPVASITPDNKEFVDVSVSGKTYKFRSVYAYQGFDNNTMYGATITITNIDGYAVSSVRSSKALVVQNLLTKSNGVYSTVSNKEYTFEANGADKMTMSRSFATNKSIVATDTLRFNGNLINNLSYTIYFSYFTYDISYVVYDNTAGNIEDLHYMNKEGNYIAFIEGYNSEEGATNQARFPLENKLYSNGNVIADTITLNYSFETGKSGDVGYKSVLIKNVPYGIAFETRITLNAEENQYRLTGWASGQAGFATPDRQTIKPTGMSGNDHIAAYSLEGQFATNVLNVSVALRYVKETGYKRASLLQQLGAKWETVNTGDGEDNIYTLPIDFNDASGNAIKQVNAGDITEFILSLTNFYHTNYNNSFTNISDKDNDLQSVLAKYFVVSDPIDFFVESSASDIDSGISYKHEGANWYLYGDHDDSVTIYLNLNEASFYGIGSELVDYLPGSTAELGNINRATISSIETTETNVYAYLYNAESSSYIKTTLDACVGKAEAFIKVPYTASTENHITVTMQPKEAASGDNSGYSVVKWKLNSNEIDNSNDNSVEIECSGMHNNLIAIVRINTFKITFKNNGEELKTIEIAYDKDLKSKYKHYGYTLDMLRKENIVPLYILDPNIERSENSVYILDGSTTPGTSDDDIIVFEYTSTPNDNGITKINCGYGRYENVFTGWGYRSDSELTEGMVLNAVYTTLPSITIVYYAKATEFAVYQDGARREIPLYINTSSKAISGGYADCNYENNIEEILDLCYIQGENTSDYVTLKEIIDKDSMALTDANLYTADGTRTNKVESDDRVFYPKYLIQLMIYNSYDDTVNESILVSYGGLVSFSAIYDNPAQQYIMKVSSGSSIVEKTYEDGAQVGLQFALWKLQAGDLKSELCHTTNCSKCAQGLKVSGYNMLCVYAHYNPMITFYVDDDLVSEDGGLQGKNGTLVSGEDKRYLLTETVPSGFVFTKNGTSTNHAAAGLIVLQLTSKGVVRVLVNSVLKYTYSLKSEFDLVTLIKCVNEDGITTDYTLEMGEQLQLTDDDGYIIVTCQAKVDVEITFDGVVINNMPSFNGQTSKNNIFSAPTGVVVPVGTKFEVKDISSPDGAELVFDGVADSYCIDFHRPYDIYKIFDNCTNFRLQYKFNNKWTDVAVSDMASVVYSGLNASDNTAFIIRLACDWITYDYTFETLASAVNNGTITLEEGKYLTLGGGKVDVTDVLKQDISIAWFYTGKTTPIQSSSRKIMSIHKGGTLSIQDYKDAQDVSHKSFVASDKAFGSSDDPSTTRNWNVFAKVPDSKVYSYIWVAINTKSICTSCGLVDTNAKICVDCNAEMLPSTHFIAIPTGVRKQISFVVADKYETGKGNIKVTVESLEDRIFNNEPTLFETEFDISVDSAPSLANVDQFAKITVEICLENGIQNKYLHTYRGYNYQNASGGLAYSNLDLNTEFSLLADNIGTSNGGAIFLAFDRASSARDIIVATHTVYSTEYHYAGTAKTYATSSITVDISTEYRFYTQCFDIIIDHGAGEESYFFGETEWYYGISGDKAYYVFLDKYEIADNLILSDLSSAEEFKFEEEMTLDYDTALGKHLVIIIPQVIYEMKVNYTISETTKDGETTEGATSSNIEFSPSQINKLITSSREGLSFYLVVDKYKAGGIYLKSGDTQMLISGKNSFMLMSVGFTNNAGDALKYAENTQDGQDLSPTREEIASMGSTLNIYIVLQEKTTAELTFMLSLPYASDYRNVNIQTFEYENPYNNMGYTPYFNNYEGNPLNNTVVNAYDYFVAYNSAIEDSSTIIKTSVITKVDSNLKLSVSGSTYTLMLKDTGIAGSQWVKLLSFDIILDYTYVGIYAKSGATFSLITPISTPYKHYSSSAEDGYYELFDQSLDEIEKIQDNTQIMLVFERKALTIDVDTNIWQNKASTYYDKLNTNAVFNSTTSYKTYNTSTEGVVSYTGLATLIPNSVYRSNNNLTNAYFYGSDKSHTPASYDDGSIFDTWILTESGTTYTNGLWISLKDSDPYVRLYTVLKTKGTMSTATAVTGKDAMPYNAYKVVGFNESSALTTSATIGYNVELLGSTRWKIINLPYGDTDYNTKRYIKVKIYDRAYTATNAKPWTSDYISFNPTGIYLPSRNKCTIINNKVVFFDSGEKLSFYGIQSDRLTQGIYCGYTGVITNAFYINDSNNFYVNGVGTSSEKYYISGYTLELYNSSGAVTRTTINKESTFYDSNNSRWPLTSFFNTDTYRKVHIYPIIEKMKTYNVTYNKGIVLHNSSNWNNAIPQDVALPLPGGTGYLAGNSYTLNLAVTSKSLLTSTSKDNKPSRTSVQGVYSTAVIKGTTYDVLLAKLVSNAGQTIELIKFDINSTSSTLTKGTYTISSNQARLEFTNPNGVNLTITPYWVVINKTLTYEVNPDPLTLQITAKGENLAINQEKYNYYIKAGNLAETSHTFAIPTNMRFNPLYNNYDGTYNSAYEYNFEKGSSFPAAYFRPINQYIYASATKVTIALQHYAHNMGEWEQLVGGQRRDCQYCSYFEYEICTHSEVTHTYGKMSGGEHKHQITCNICGSEELKVEPCQYSEDSQKLSPTCTETGLIRCILCQRWNETTPAYGHLYYCIVQNGKIVKNPALTAQEQTDIYNKLVSEETERLRIAAGASEGVAGAFYLTAKANIDNQLGLSSTTDCNVVYTRCVRGYCTHSKLLSSGVGHTYPTQATGSFVGTCQERSYTYKDCTKCGYRKKDYGNKGNHVYGAEQEGTVIVYNPDPGTCKAEVVYTYTKCKYCDRETAHTYKKVKNSYLHDPIDDSWWLTDGKCGSCHKNIEKPSILAGQWYDSSSRLMDNNYSDAADLFIYRYGNSYRHGYSAGNDHWYAISRRPALVYKLSQISNIYVKNAETGKTYTYSVSEFFTSDLDEKYLMITDKAFAAFPESEWSIGSSLEWSPQYKFYNAGMIPSKIDIYYNDNRVSTWTRTEYDDDDDYSMDCIGSFSEAKVGYADDGWWNYAGTDFDNFDKFTFDFYYTWYP